MCVSTGELQGRKPPYCLISLLDVESEPAVSLHGAVPSRGLKQQRASLLDLYMEAQIQRHVFNLLESVTLNKRFISRITLASACKLDYCRQ